jgi:hypothetical protein
VELKVELVERVTTSSPLAATANGGSTVILSAANWPVAIVGVATGSGVQETRARRRARITDVYLVI